MTAVPEWIDEYAATVGPEPDATLAEMAEYADREGFPIVGPAVGGWLEVLARMVDAERVFEFGSGYGYSAYWFARALPDEGEIVLTEVDADELDLAREYLARGDFGATIQYEHGDALETIEAYDGPFDVVLIDNEKSRYREAFEAVRAKIPPGGVVVADNAITAGSIDPDAVMGLLTGERSTADAGSAGIASLADALRDDPEFVPTLLPVGSGVLVAIRSA